MASSGLRASVSGLAGVFGLVALAALAGCSDGASSTGVATESGSAAPVERVERGTVRDDRFPDDVPGLADVEPVVRGDVAIRAETVVRDGDAYVEITIESAAPDALDLWAIELDGQITTRTSDNPGSTLGIALEPFGLDDGEPFEVVVIAEDRDGAAIASSDARVLSAPVGPVEGPGGGPDARPFGSEQDDGSRG